MSLAKGQGREHSMQHTKELAPRIVLMWDDETGIARIENYLTGVGHTAHPNIKRPRSAEDMKRREAWGKDDRVVQSHSFLYNIDRLSSMSRSTMWPVSIASAAAIMQRNAGMTFHASNGWNPPLTCRESGVGLQPHAWPGSPASACRYNPRMIPCQSAVATVALTRGTPTDRVMWPLPVRSSATTTSPDPKRRIVPS